MGARALFGGLGGGNRTPQQPATGEATTSPTEIAGLMAGSGALGRIAGLFGKRKAKPRPGTLLSAPADTTGKRASDDAAAAGTARDRVRTGGTFLGGDY